MFLTEGKNLTPMQVEIKKWPQKGLPYSDSVICRSKFELTVLVQITKLLSLYLNTHWNRLSALRFHGFVYRGLFDRSVFIIHRSVGIKIWVLLS